MLQNVTPAPHGPENSQTDWPPENKRVAYQHVFCFLADPIQQRCSVIQQRQLASLFESLEAYNAICSFTIFLWEMEPTCRLEASSHCDIRCDVVDGLS